MFTELNCGKCESYFQVDSDDEDAVWLMMHRFANAHADCGYMLPLGESDDSTVKKVIKPRLLGDAEEA